MTDIFGSNGLAFDFFGGQWWLVGMLIVFLFSTYLYASGFSQEAMSLFIFCSVILVTIDGLFSIPSDWLIIIVTFILVLLGFSVNKFLRG